MTESKVADVWDEGWKQGATDTARFLGWATSEGFHRERPQDSPNPYRESP